jgi:hypothetical protein
MKRRASALAFAGSLLAGTFSATTFSATSFSATNAAPIVIIDSRHTLASAEAGCALYPGPAAVALCHSVADPRRLGRDLENKIVSQFAVTPQCRGVAIALLLDPSYDGAFSQAAIDLIQKDYWSLHVDYAPVGERYGWTLFPQTVAPTASASIASAKPRTVNGEGTVAQIAQQVCVAVTGRGAGIR